MTEVGSVSTQRAGLVDYGTLGIASPSYELRIAEDGELLVRGPHTASKYRNRPVESKATFDTDGWVHTGDLGELDAAGRLRLIGRKKEIILPAHGHNVAPARLESALLDECTLIAHACVIGDGHPHLTAIIAIDPSLAQDEEARMAIAAAVERVNGGLEPLEQIAGHTVVADPWLPGAELTETMKMRRAHISERYASTIDGLYAQ